MQSYTGTGRQAGLYYFWHLPGGSYGSLEDPQPALKLQNVEKKGGKHTSSFHPESFIQNLQISGRAEKGSQAAQILHRVIATLRKVLKKCLSGNLKNTEVFFVKK